MNLLHQLRSERINANVPVVKVFEKSKDLKMIAIALGKNVILKEHKTHMHSRLIVLEGKIEYKEGEKSFSMKTFDEFIIPLNKLHSLEAKEDSLCLLIQKVNG